MEPAAGRVQTLAVAILGFFSVGIVLSFLFRLPYQFPGRGSPDNIGGDVFLRGTALAAPLLLIAVFAIFGLLAPRADRSGRTGLIGAASLAALFALGAVGELARVDGFTGAKRILVSGWSVITIVLALAVVLMGLVALRRRTESETDVDPDADEGSRGPGGREL